jgi:hypothetical protein
MVQGVQFRRGTTAQHAVFTGQPGEITVDSDKKIVVVHDGSAVGGYEVVGAGTTQRITNKDVNATSLNVVGVSTVSGSILVGTSVSTGTASQSLQVTGGAYVSGNLGIGTTTPTSKLQVIGTALITGITTVGLGTTSTPPSNSQMSFELTSNTNLRIKVRGTDGVLRSSNITLT